MFAGIRFGGMAILLLALAAPVTRAADDAAIKKAIARGVASLKQIQKPDGTWDDGNMQHLIGVTALAALTLLECDVPADDPAVKKAAEIIRATSSELLHTYSISLAILFLDRLGNADDEGIIQMLVTRLLAGQNGAGGWTYHCPGVFAPAEIRRLTTVPRARGKTEGKRAAPESQRNDKELSRELRQILQVIERQVAAGQVPLAPGLGGGDNSNTQFATLALWVGRRHGLPVDKALGRIESRYRNSQWGDGGWGYMLLPARFAGNSNSTPAMTCAGLLGLAVARGAANEARLRTSPKTDPDSGPDKSTPPADPSKDPAVEAGLIYLGGRIGEPAGAQAAPGPPGPGFFRPGPSLDGAPNYYFLWSVERVAMAFGLQTIGKKDWYAWGSQVLLAYQGENGGWGSRYIAGGVDTCFALLFLRRSNLARDLSTSLKGQVKDPGERTLRSGGVGGGALANPGSRSDPDLREPGKDERGDKSPHPKLILGPEKKPRAPAPQEKRAPRLEDEERITAEAERLSAQLVKANPERQEALLEKLREGKGAVHTQALAAAIPQLAGAAKTKAREALAKRLARMTDTTLRDKLQDEDLEIRRAAALACAVKDEKEFVPDLIKLLKDPEPPVHRAAHAALTTLTGKDFGPGADASRAERAQAIDKWKEWWAKQNKK